MLIMIALFCNLILVKTGFEPFYCLSIGAFTFAFVYFLKLNFRQISY